MWACSEAGLSRLPVTEEIAGSNPVEPAKQNLLNTTKVVFFISIILYVLKQSPNQLRSTKL